MFHSTTILSVRRGDDVAIGGDGQVSHGQAVMKAKARKIRRLYEDKIIVGFAGSTADAFALMERLEGKLKAYQGNLLKAAHELAREWRTDRVLRRLESLIIAIDKKNSLLLSGGGDVIIPDDGVLGIGSGGQYAVAAARALLANTSLPPAEIVEKSLLIAADICVYTNREIIVDKLSDGGKQ
ncbi:MAG TPA: ATP-dependent protease subunit HslV [Planctomycetota bacterium]|nr:ATP-dependent protease subunit HslV [Planctomycetota bacterium]